jgi:hypothetical protein
MLGLQGFNSFKDSHRIDGCLEIRQIHTDTD